MKFPLKVKNLTFIVLIITLISCPGCVEEVEEAKEDFKDELKAEIKAELEAEEELKAELTEEITAELTEEIRAELEAEQKAVQDDVALEELAQVQLKEITDLSVDVCELNSCTLNWTVPNNSSSEPEIDSYEVRYITEVDAIYTEESITDLSTLNESLFQAASIAAQDTASTKPGEVAEFRVEGLESGNIYSFLVKSNAVANGVEASEVSNRLKVTTSTPIQLSKIITLDVKFCEEDSCTLTWEVPKATDSSDSTSALLIDSSDSTSAPPIDSSDSASALPIESYIVSYSTAPFGDDDYDYDLQSEEYIVISPKEAGEIEEFKVPLPTGFETYYFSIKSSNDTNITSAYSNLVNGTTLLEGVLFEDNFDEHTNWTAEQLTISYGYWEGEDSIPQNYQSYRVQGTVFADNVKNDTLSITDINYRGDTGKALTIWNETASDKSSWVSDGLLGLELEDEHEALFIRFFIKFDPFWQWGTGNGSPMHKIFRVSHWNGTSPFVMSEAHGPMMIHDLAKYRDGLADIAVNSSFRYSNVYYPATASPTHYNSKQTYFEGGSYGGGGTDFYDLGMTGDGEWHEWKFYVQMNSAEGVPDGVYKFWQDNKLVVEETDLAWQDNGAAQRDMWNYIMLGGNNYNRFATSLEEKEQWFAIDDLVISTSDIPSDYIPLNKEN